MAYTYTLIKSGTVTNATQASIEFTSIPQTYTDLQILMSVRYSGSDTTGVNVVLNGDTSTNYTVRVLRGTGAGGAPQNNTSAQTFDFTAWAAGGSTTGSSGSSQTASTCTNTCTIYTYESADYLTRLIPSRPCAINRTHDFIDP